MQQGLGAAQAEAVGGRPCGCGPGEAAAPPGLAVEQQFVLLCCFPAALAAALRDVPAEHQAPQGSRCLVAYPGGCPPGAHPVAPGLPRSFAGAAD